MAMHNKAVELHIVNAFTSAREGGNQAAVCLLEQWLDDEVLRSIAAQAGPSVTAFVELTSGTDALRLRWFTRGGREVFSFCGHATFAAAHILSTRLPRWEAFAFDAFCGSLRLLRTAEGLTMTGPSWPVVEHPLPEDLEVSLGALPERCYRGERDWLLRYADGAMLRNLAPDFNRMRRLGDTGIIATAPLGSDSFAFRFFCPGFSIGEDEDPGTGSALSSLAPYWAGQLQHASLSAEQWSSRRAQFRCTETEDGVVIVSECAIVEVRRLELAGNGTEKEDGI